MPHCSPMTTGSVFAVPSASTPWTTLRSKLLVPLSPFDIVPSMIFVLGAGERLRQGTFEEADVVRGVPQARRVALRVVRLVLRRQRGDGDSLLRVGRHPD